MKAVIFIKKHYQKSISDDGLQKFFLKMRIYWAVYTLMEMEGWIRLVNFLAQYRKLSRQFYGGIWQHKDYYVANGERKKPLNILEKALP